MNLYDRRRIGRKLCSMRSHRPEGAAGTARLNRCDRRVRRPVLKKIGRLPAPVVIGGEWLVRAATGAGVVREGSAYLCIAPHSWKHRHPSADLRSSSTPAHLGAVPGLYTPWDDAGQVALQWLRDTLCQAERHRGCAQFERV
jgi:hypothetical protein